LQRQLGAAHRPCGDEIRAGDAHRRRVPQCLAVHAFDDRLDATQLEILTNVVKEKIHRRLTRRKGLSRPIKRDLRGTKFRRQPCLRQHTSQRDTEILDHKHSGPMVASSPRSDNSLTPFFSPAIALCKIVNARCIPQTADAIAVLTLSSDPRVSISSRLLLACGKINSVMVE
jgi:hypothetical protein